TRNHRSDLPLYTAHPSVAIASAAPASSRRRAVSGSINCPSVLLRNMKWLASTHHGTMLMPTAAAGATREKMSGRACLPMGRLRGGGGRLGKPPLAGLELMEARAEPHRVLPAENRPVFRRTLRPPSRLRVRPHAVAGGERGDGEGAESVGDVVLP